MSDKKRSRQSINQERNYAYIWAYKCSHPCVDCGEKDPIVLEFDHRAGTKLFNIGEGGRHRSMHNLKAEIEKCDVRCANCHRRKTWLANRIKFNKSTI